MSFVFNTGKRLTSLRTSHGLTMNKLSRLSGVSQSFISNIEAGTKNPTIDTIDRLATAMGITLYDFFNVEKPSSVAENNEYYQPQIKHVIHKIQKLTPRQIKILNEVLDEWLIASKNNEH